MEQNLEYKSKAKELATKFKDILNDVKQTRTQYQKILTELHHEHNMNQVDTCLDFDSKMPEFKQEDIYLTNVQKQLNKIKSKSNFSDLSAILYNLLNKLNELKFQFTENEWKMFIEFTHKQHPQLLKLFHEDPFTKRSFNQPRGFAGDAVTLDMIYTKSFKDKNVSMLGQQIFEAFMRMKSTESIRERGRFIGKYIDNLYKERGTQLNVLTVACGHLREIESCQQFWRGNINVFAMDQDIESLRVVKSDYMDKGYNVKTINDKIKMLFDTNYCTQILKVNNDRKFDLIWSAGLYDYLNDKSSKLLTKKLFNMVKPNGKLLIGNCFSNLCCGYMECFMNWTLIYRNIDEIRGFASQINSNEIQQVKEIQFECFAFIEITKKIELKNVVRQI